MKRSVFMTVNNIILRDKYGYPVTTYSGHHPIINFFRAIIHTNIKTTLR